MEEETLSDAEAPDAPAVVIHDIQEPREPELEVASELALWRAVLTQALMDAGNLSQQYELRLEREKARRWLLGNQHDFAFVCWMAGYDPRDVRAKARAALARDCVCRKPPDMESKSTNRR